MQKILKNIKLLIMDCDGVLTDAGMYYSPKKERLFGGIMHLKRRAPVLG